MHLILLDLENYKAYIQFDNIVSIIWNKELFDKKPTAIPSRLPSDYEKYHEPILEESSHIMTTNDFIDDPFTDEIEEDIFSLDSGICTRCFLPKEECVCKEMGLYS